MPVNSTHPDYDASVTAWSRARDVMAGEDALKAAGERYLPRLDSQTDEEYAAYKERAAFFNATARTAEGYVGLIFRRPPFIKTPEDGGLGSALSEFVNDADMLGTPLVSYAKNVIGEVIAVGRCGTLIDWESEVENRAYVSRYAAENILNWRVERINGRNITTLVALLERGTRNAERGMKDTDPFVDEVDEQIRVLRLVDGGELKVESATSPRPSPPSDGGEGEEVRRSPTITNRKSHIINPQMGINITKAFRSGLDILFNVAVELVRDATYYRPASFSKATGLTTATEQTAAVKALLTNYRPQELGTVVIQPGDDKVLIRAVELAGITAPASGDYLVEASTGQRRDVLAAKLDATGLLWTLQTVRSLNEDWGDLSAVTVSADWGDLNAATETDDWLTLT